MTKQNDKLHDIHKTEANESLKREKDFQKEEQQVSELLNNYGMKRKMIPKDGSCLFRAVSDQLFHTQKYQKYIRKECVKYLELNRDEFEAYIWDMPFDKYCKQMKNENVWGGQIEVESICRRFGFNIVVYSRRGIEAEHKRDSHTETINLCFSHGNHYDSVYPTEFFDHAIEMQDIIYEMLESKLGITERSERKGTFRNVEHEAWLEKAAKRSAQDRRRAKKFSSRKKESFPALPVRPSPPRQTEHSDTIPDNHTGDASTSVNDSNAVSSVDNNTNNNNNNIDKSENQSENQNENNDKEKQPHTTKKEPAWGQRVDWKEMFANKGQDSEYQSQNEEDQDNSSSSSSSSSVSRQGQGSKPASNRVSPSNKSKTRYNTRKKRFNNNNNNKNNARSRKNKPFSKHSKSLNSPNNNNNNDNNNDNTKTNTKANNNNSNNNNNNERDNRNDEKSHTQSSNNTISDSKPKTNSAGNNPWSRSKDKPSFSAVLASAVTKDDHAQEEKDENSEHYDIDSNDNNNNNNNSNNSHDNNINNNTVESIPEKDLKYQQQKQNDQVKRKENSSAVTKKKKMNKKKKKNNINNNNNNNNKFKNQGNEENKLTPPVKHSSSTNGDIKHNNVAKTGKATSSAPTKICFGEFDDDHESDPVENHLSAVQNNDDIIQTAQIYASEDTLPSRRNQSKINHRNHSNSNGKNTNQKSKSFHDNNNNNNNNNNTDETQTSNHQYHNVQPQQQQQQPQPQPQQPIPPAMPFHMPPPAGYPMQQYVQAPSFSPDTFPVNGTPGHVTMHSGGYGYPMPPSPVYPVPAYGFYQPPPMMQPQMMPQQPQHPQYHPSSSSSYPPPSPAGEDVQSNNSKPQ